MKTSTIEFKNLTDRLLSSLPRIRNNDSKEIINAFFDNMTEKKISGNWTLHLHFLDWLIKRNVALDESERKTLIIASLVDWSLAGFDHPDAKGLIIQSPHLAPVMALWKSDDPVKGHRIVRLQTKQSDVTKHCYGITYDVALWQHTRFQEIPK